MSNRPFNADILNLSLGEPHRNRRERLKLQALLLIQQQRHLQQRQRLSEALFVSRTACINKLRMEQKRLQQKSLEEMNLLQQRLRVQQEKAVEEIRELKMRHRQQHVALLKCIEQRKIIQCLIGDNVNRNQEGQGQRDGQSLYDEDDENQQIVHQKSVASKGTSTL